MCAGDIRTLLRKESSMPILPSMNTFIELRQEEDYKHIFHESTGLISQVLQGCNVIMMTFARGRPGTSSGRPSRRTWCVRAGLFATSRRLKISPSIWQRWWRRRKELRILMIKFTKLDLLKKLWFQVMEEKRGLDGRTEVGSLCHQFALESIATIFYGARFRVLRGEQVEILWTFFFIKGDTRQPLSLTFRTGATWLNPWTISCRRVSRWFFFLCGYCYFKVLVIITFNNITFKYLL